MSHTILLYESLSVRIEGVPMFFFFSFLMFFLSFLIVTTDVLQKIVISTALTGVFLKDEDGSFAEVLDLLSR
jgi:hypothetical protein